LRFLGFLKENLVEISLRGLTNFLLGNKIENIPELIFLPYFIFDFIIEPQQWGAIFDFENKICNR